MSPRADAARQPATRVSDTRRLMTALWAVSGVSFLLIEPVIRLGARASRTLMLGIAPFEWLLLSASVVLFGYFEGYRVLHQRFAAAVVERAFAVPTRGAGFACGAPLFALALIGGTSRERRRAWAGVALIVTAALTVQALPSPYRELVDAGVVVALAIGIVSMAVRFRAHLEARRVS